MAPLHGEALGLQIPTNFFEHHLLAAKKMGGAGHIQQKAISAIKRHEGREAVAPVGNICEQVQIGWRVCRHNLERWQHGTRIGERLTDGKPKGRRLAVKG